MEIDLRSLDERILSKMREHGYSALARAAADELVRRSTPRFDGPITVRLGGRNYAFQSTFLLAPGDWVDVDTSYGTQKGQVVAHGTGSWDPTRHGRLKYVRRVIA